jgi:hypothetical protein
MSPLYWLQCPRRKIIGTACACFDYNFDACSVISEISDIITLLIVSKQISENLMTIFAHYEASISVKTSSVLRCLPFACHTPLHCYKLWVGLICIVVVYDVATLQQGWLGFLITLCCVTKCNMTWMTVCLQFHFDLLVFRCLICMRFCRYLGVVELVIDVLRRHCLRHQLSRRLRSWIQYGCDVCNTFRNVG